MCEVMELEITGKEKGRQKKSSEEHVKNNIKQYDCTIKGNHQFLLAGIMALKWTLLLLLSPCSSVVLTYF